MKIRLGKIDFKFGYAYILVMFIILGTDGMFYDLIFGEPLPGEEPKENISKYIIMLGFVFSSFYVNRLSPFLRNFLILNYIYLLCLMLESYYRSGSFFQYPHVFSKIMVLYLVFFAYAYFKNVKENALMHIIYLILIGFILDVIIYKNDILSISSFVDVNRGLTAASTYMLLLPCLYFFNKYLEAKKAYHLFIFFIMAGFILFLQHRTVWISTIVAFSINFLFIRKSSLNVTMGTLTPIITTPLIIGFLVFSFVLSTNPEVLATFGERISDIQNVETQGTGSWRLDQFKSYWPFIIDNPIIGMRFEGFELPIQFYSEGDGSAVFIDGTGHHFHSFYVDRLFYLGIVGTIFLLIPIIYVIVRAVKKPFLSTSQLTLVSYVGCMLMYGLSYNLPTYVFGIIGMALGLLEKEVFNKEPITKYAVHRNTRLQQKKIY